MTEEVRMLATMRKFPDQIPNHTIKIDTGIISSTSVEEMNTLPLMQGFFLDTFLANQLNWSWRFLSFSEILFEFFQNLA